MGGGGLTRCQGREGEVVVICMRHSKLRYTLSMSVYEECSIVSLSVSGLPGHLASSQTLGLGSAAAAIEL